MVNAMPAVSRQREPSFLGRTAIVSTGYTALTKDSGATVLALATEACRAALEQAGVERAEIDGIVSYSLFGDSVACQAVATALAVPQLTYALDLNMGGVAPALCVMQAAMAVASGVASNVLVFRALNGRSGVRIGQTPFPAPTTAYRRSVGLTAYPQYMALLARRYMIETGATEDDLGAVVVAQSEYAAENERAIRRRRVTLAEHREARYVVEPFRTLDCTSEVDGACAVLVTSLDRARRLTDAPVVIEGAAWATGAGSGLDIADLLSWPDYSRICQHYLADRLWQGAGLRPHDMDVAEIYDCFSAMALLGIEGLGLAERGGAGELVRSGETSLRGRIPINTHGGLLFEGYLHGMNTLAEGVQQLQGRGGSRQVAGAGRCVVSSGAMGDGSALVLVRDGA
jgi:acetyl-CoA acetyltransferase